MADLRAQQLADQFKALNDSLLDISSSCTDAQWATNVEGENWPAGAVVHHVAMGHYSIIGLIKRAVRGQALPDLSALDLDKENEKQLVDGTSFSKEMAVEALTKNGGKIYDFMAALSDEELDAKHHWSLWGIDGSVEKIFKMVFLHSGNEHLESIKTAFEK